MTCWASSHKWQYAQTGSALVRLTGTRLMQGGNQASTRTLTPVLRLLAFRSFVFGPGSLLLAAFSASREQRLGVFKAAVCFVKNLPFSPVCFSLNKRCFDFPSVRWFIQKAARTARFTRPWCSEGPLIRSVQWRIHASNSVLTVCARCSFTFTLGVFSSSPFQIPLM